MAQYYSPLPGQDGFGQLDPEAGARRTPAESMDLARYGSEPGSRASTPTPDEFQNTNTAYNREANYQEDNSLLTQTNTKYSGYSDIEHNKLLSEKQEFRTYKRRFIGLGLLVVLNIVHAWASMQFNIVSPLSAEYFGVSVEAIDWFSTASALIYAPVAPFVIWVLNKGGPKLGIIVSAVTLVVGNWIRYAGTKIHSFPVVMVGTIIMGAGQPFVLSSPTRYSRMWFTDRGRTSATAVATLAEALGSGVGALVTVPLLEGVGMSGSILVTCVIGSAFAIPTFFIPKEPATPPSVVASAPTMSIWKGFLKLWKIPVFYLQFVSFVVVYAAINASNTLIAQAIAPYGGKPEEAGISAALMIFIGIGVATIVSPILDRLRCHIIALKIIVPILASTFIALIFVPQTGSAVGLYVTFAAMGAAAFSITPCVLEFQSASTHPVPPEISSVVCWTGGHLFQAALIVIMSSLTNTSEDLGQPKGSLIKGYIVQAVLVWLVVPCALLTDVGPFKRPKSSQIAGTSM